MLKLIEGSCASFFPRETDAMFRNRAQTFSERLGWEVVVKDGYERDVFDEANPLYLVAVDPDTETILGFAAAPSHDRPEHVARRLPLSAGRRPDH